AISIMQWYWISGGLLLLVAMVSYVFVSSDAGRILVAIRENEERCRYLGLRSSGLKIRLMAACSAVAALAGACYVLFGSVAAHSYGDFVFGTELVVWTALGGRSEEHTSELQSPYELVCRLLLEKKNSLSACMVG